MKTMVKINELYFFMLTNSLYLPDLALLKKKIDEDSRILSKRCCFIVYLTDKRKAFFIIRLTLSYTDDTVHTPFIQNKPAAYNSLMDSLISIQ